jgi:4-amino-4-deoxy-L-arabinose transferase-like glycosyltransferase
MDSSSAAMLESRPGGKSPFGRIPFWLIVFSLFAGAGILQSLSVDWTRQLTIYDEVPHIDYVFRLAEGDLTTWDDTYSQRTLGIADCLEVRSDNPQCVTAELRDPQERWPNGYSYEAMQAPGGYLPFALAAATAVDAAGDHYSQIRQLRVVNVGLWLIFAAIWTFLIVHVTSNRLAAAAASVTVALNPLLFDRFTYVTNDGPAVIAATATAAWLLYFLTRRTGRWWVWVVPSIALGLAMGLIKATALIVLVPIVLAAWASFHFASKRPPTVQWWLANLLIAATTAVSAIGYTAYINASSSSDFGTVFSLILPKGDVDGVTASLFRISDISDVVTGSGSRSSAQLFEWGFNSPSAPVLLLSLAAAAAFLVSLALHRNAFDRCRDIDPRILGFAVLAGFLMMVIANPLLHYLRGEFLMPFGIGRFQATLLPLAGLAMLPAFTRFRGWSVAMIVGGLVVAAFAS